MLLFIATEKTDIIEHVRYFIRENKYVSFTAPTYLVKCFQNVIFLWVLCNILSVKNKFVKAD